MLILTLRQMAVNELATFLFNSREFEYLQEKYKSPIYLLPEEKWEHLIKEKLPPSSCPTALRQEITAAIRPISFEVGNWILDHLKTEKGQSKIIKIPLLWKSDGTINRVKTADMIIQSQNFSVELRFRMACKYWCWHEIIKFLEGLSPNENLIIYRKYAKYSLVTCKHIQYCLKFIANIRHSCQRFALEFPWTCVTMFNRVFDHLPLVNKIELEIKAVKFGKIPLARHCLSRMDAQRRMRTLQLYPYHVLRIYLFWPLQALFIDAAATVKEVLSNHSFLQLIHIIICQKILPGWRDFDYRDLLRRFWQGIPERCKEYVKGDGIFNILMVILEGKGFRTSLRSGVPRRYLAHDRTLIENALKCSRLTFFSAN
ncbi:uncharacterized protein TNCT_710321 [Trichonephila clavata]|uniref:Uncharacterized protein n=1 Tax=Trichonephila clavata TaxID=2740835 RepID=A0A8X6G7J4_TRICU|nr:uncharacterized protein TNCT_710321 [Trichonephila clavata]